MASRNPMAAGGADGDGSVTLESTGVAPGGMSREENYAEVAPIFAEKFGRAPLPSDDPRALINDVIFWRMIEPRWTAHERALVDKSTAKEVAQALVPGLRAPRTLATIAMDRIGSPTDLYCALAPFVGTDAIAKPAQASGGVVFLRSVTGPGDLEEIYALATRDYAQVLREMQYAGLPRRIIVETLVPTADGGSPDDFKFHCIRGEPLLCQVDHARFGAAWSRVLRLPDFTPLDPDDGMVPPDSLAMPTAARLAEMADAARAIAAPFEYVRVDLYAGLDGTYFGEVTFTPAASFGIAPSAAGCHRVSETHRQYSQVLMDALRRPALRSAI